MRITGLYNLRVPLPRSNNVPGVRDFVLPNHADDVLIRQRYKTTIHFYDRYQNADGSPTTKNLDNVAKPLVDAIAAAYGLGKRGRGDEWLDWELHLYKHDSGIDEPYALVTVERLS